MDSAIGKTIEALGRRLINGWAADDAAAARDIILKIVPADAVVGTGDSSSVRQVGAVTALEARGNRVINGFDLSHEIKDLQTHFDYGFWPMIEATICDVFLTGSNALTEDGKIVNIDGNGNRVAGMFWGHPISILVVGKNKIVRRIFEHLGYKVIKLDRVYFAGLTKKNLKRGKWRFLTDKEVSMLKRGIF